MLDDLSSSARPRVSNEPQKGRGSTKHVLPIHRGPSPRHLFLFFCVIRLNCNRLYSVSALPTRVAFRTCGGKCIAICVLFNIDLPMGNRKHNTDPSALTLSIRVSVVCFCCVVEFTAVSPLYFLCTVHFTRIIVYRPSRVGLFSKLVRDHTTASKFFDRGFMDIYMRYMLPPPSCTID